MAPRPIPPIRYQIYRRLIDGPASAEDLSILIGKSISTVRFAVHSLRCEGHTIDLVRSPSAPGQYTLKQGDDHDRRR